MTHWDVEEPGEVTGRATGGEPGEETGRETGGDRGAETGREAVGGGGTLESSSMRSQKTSSSFDKVASWAAKAPAAVNASAKKILEVNIIVATTGTTGKITAAEAAIFGLWSNDGIVCASPVHICGASRSLTVSTLQRMLTMLWRPLRQLENVCLSNRLALQCVLL